jgi:GT2 family glycosyltransferase
MSRLLAVMVTYRRETIALETLRTVMEQDRPPDRIWVVDNSPTDSFRSTVEGLDKVVYLPSESNLGPAGGYAVGMQSVLEYAEDDDTLLLIDDDDPPPDVAVVGRLLTLLESFDESERVGCVGLVGSRFDRSKALTVRVPDAELQGIVDVDCVAGNQFPLLSVRAVREVGVYDPRLFFGFEELDFALRLRSAGWRVVVDGETILAARSRYGRLGRGKRSPGRVRPAWRRYYSSRNIVLIAKRHGRPGARWIAFAHAGPAAALRSLVVHRSPRRSWMAIRGAIAGLLGRTGMVVLPE